MIKARVLGLKRRRSAASYRKLAITVPSQLAVAVEKEVRARHAPSVSAFISDAVEEKLERDRLQEALDEVWGERPMTTEERAWADKILRG
jgi:metal-responsive CopG/Arc/MetJ family transcriptional regulator